MNRMLWIVGIFGTAILGLVAWNILSNPSKVQVASGPAQLTPPSKVNVPSAPAPQAPAQQTTAYRPAPQIQAQQHIEGACDGWGVDITLTSQPKLPNKGTDCEMDWDIISSGDVILVNQWGKDAPPMRRGSPPIPNFTYVALKGSATIYAHFCPRHSHWDGQRCSGSA